MFGMLNNKKLQTRREVNVRLNCLDPRNEPDPDVLRNFKSWRLEQLSSPVINYNDQNDGLVLKQLGQLKRV